MDDAQFTTIIVRSGTVESPPPPSPVPGTESRPTEAQGRSGGPAAGQLYELYVHADHREKGIGRRLCAEVARRMAGRGMGAFYVEVLEGNPNRFFYEALGARLVARTHHDFAGQRMPSVVYLWTDLKTLADHRAA